MKSPTSLIIFIFSSSLWANDINFSGAISLEICPKNSGCFRKHVAVTPTVTLINIYEDADVIIEYGTWDETQTVQKYEITGSLELTKTFYKSNKETYWEYVSVVKHINTRVEAKSNYTFRDPTEFNGVLTSIAQNISKKGKIQRFPVFILAPEGYKLNLTNQ